MPPIPVRLRRSDGSSTVRVHGMENTEWLLRQLSQVFVFKSSEPIVEFDDSQECSFRVVHSSQTSGHRLERLLAAIPGVQMLLDSMATSGEHGP